MILVDLFQPNLFQTNPTPHDLMHTKNCKDQAFHRSTNQYKQSLGISCQLSRPNGKPAPSKTKNNHASLIPSKIKQDLTNGPLGNVQELLDTQIEGSIHWVLLGIS